MVCIVNKYCMTCGLTYSGSLTNYDLECRDCKDKKYRDELDKVKAEVKEKITSLYRDDYGNGIKDLVLKTVVALAMDEVGEKYFWKRALDLLTSTKEPPF